MGRRAGVQFVVATGGGTVVDTAKAVAAMIPARGRGQTCHAWLESGAADADTNESPSAASKAAAWPEALPLVCVPSTAGGAIAAASPRMALHAVDEQLLAAPHWRPPCAPPTATVGTRSPNAAAQAVPWPYPRATVFANHTYFAQGFVPSAEALQLLAAQVVDLLLARAHNVSRAEAKDEDDDDDDDDELANPAHDLDESETTQRLAGVLVGLRRTFAAFTKDLEAAGEKSIEASSRPSGSSYKEADLREELLRLALELGVLAGLPQMGRAPGAALARALQPQHLPHEPWKRAMPALTAHALTVAPPLAASGAVAAAPFALVDSSLAAALVAADSAMSQKDCDSDAVVAEWDALVRRWVVAEAPGLLVAAHALKPGKAGTAAATASLVPVGSASSADELVESVQAACLVAQPTMAAAPGGLRDLWPGWPLPASNKAARAAFSKLLEPVAGAPGA